MNVPALPSNELERLSSLYRYDLLDSLPEEQVNDIARIASEICETHMSLVTLLDAERQWFKAKVGLDGDQTPRGLSFCAHAILNPAEIMEVPDSSKDVRFHDNPYVTGDPHVAFYAGVPLVNKDGYPMGTLCVLDDKPKQLTESQRESLQSLARQVMALFELRRANIELEQGKQRLQDTNEELERFAYVIAHDLKSPCNNIISLTDLVIDAFGDKLDADGYQMLGYLKSTSSGMKRLVDDVLKHARTLHELSGDKMRMSFSSLMEQVKSFIPLPAKFRLEYQDSDKVILAPATALLQILLNLCTNAVKYNDKEFGLIKVRFYEEQYFYRFEVSDNGIGIPAASFGDIFGLFHKVNKNDDQDSHGIGLSTVKKLVERFGGHINIQSVVGEGSTFTFTIKK